MKLYDIFKKNGYRLNDICEDLMFLLLLFSFKEFLKICSTCEDISIITTIKNIYKQLILIQHELSLNVYATIFFIKSV